jgi:hypothetical protein
MDKLSISLILFLLFFCRCADSQPPGLSPSTADGEESKRDWGPTTNGVRAYLAVDKLIYTIGEDVPLHIAIENLSATQSIYDEPFRGHSLYYSGRTASIKIAVQDEDGPLNPRFDISSPMVELGGGLSVCPSLLLPGKPSSFEGSLRQFGLLPRKPGTYKITVTWSPYMVDVPACDHGLVAAVAPSPQRKVILSVSSNPVYVQVESDSPSSKLPEYTAWRNHFSLVDTSFGEKTALLDKKTHLEWLRLNLTSDLSFDEVHALTAVDGPFAGWRVATSKELRVFFADFTRSPTGHSTDPLIAEKLQRLLGGPLEEFSDQTTGWHREDSNGFVGDESVPDGSMVHFQGGTVLEDSNPLVGSIVDPASGISVSARQYGSRSWGSFLVRHK